MAWPKIITPGTVTVHEDGIVHVEGFHFKDAGSCRIACQLALAWAAEKIATALVEDMTADAPKLSALD